MKTILTIARLIAGLVFVFSGFVKAIDPMGSAIKFEEYFMAFNMDFLEFVSLPLAILLSSAELMIGLNLMAKVRIRLTAWLLLLFMSFFTILTLVLALSNPVSDCGCFGDAIKLTNWQTFYKNVILFIPVLIVFKFRKRYSATASDFTEWYLASVNFIIPVLLSVFCLIHQPLLDFRPYKTGTHIPSAMVLPAGVPVDQYETVLVYEKDGMKKEFSETNFPWQDTTWKWVETKQKLIFKGEEPPIHDFTISTLEGEDITARILSDSNYVFLIIAPELEEASRKGIRKMNELSLKASALNFSTYCLTSSPTSEINEFINSVNPAFTVCISDETTLKTILRANPGLMLLKDGIIIGKWNFRDVPETDEITTNMLGFVLDEQRSSADTLTILVFSLLMLFFYSVFHRVFIRKTIA
ncbi:MAG TPA: BT_3928 family protein [Bacteroidales bacterium]|jgi:uncharacterized membrane protein YphA (DoxX/SURF4 family)|nr:BT_3928 family protein [Bacteroidales bacterium]